MILHNQAVKTAKDRSVYTERSFAYTRYMEPKKTHGKTLVFVTVVVLVLAGIGFYYASAILSSETRPATKES